MSLLDYRRHRTGAAPASAATAGVGRKLYGDDSLDHDRATLEGGDITVIGPIEREAVA